MCLLAKIIERGYDLNLHTLKNEPSTFRKHTEIYKYISELCATKISSYSDIILFRKKFSDRFHLVQKKYEALAHACEKVAENGLQITECESSFSDLSHIFKNKKHSIYQKETKYLEEIADAIKNLVQENEQKNVFSEIKKNDFVRFYTANWKNYDPSNKISLALEILRIYDICEIIEREYSYSYYTPVKVSSFFGLFKYPPEFYQDMIDRDKGYIKKGIELCHSGSSYGLDSFFADAEKALIKRDKAVDEIVQESIQGYNREVDYYNQYIRESNNANRLADENRAREKREKAEACAKCEIDYNNSKNRFPREEKELLFFTVDKPGRFYMKNGEEYYFYRNDEGGWYVKGFIFDDKFGDLKKMIEHFEEKCREKYCR